MRSRNRISSLAQVMGEDKARERWAAEGPELGQEREREDRQEVRDR
jgi:hypothetical protein